MSSLGAVTGAFTQLQSAMSSFVGAFSPSAVLALNQAMYDLSAVVGSALLPVFNLLTSAVRQFSSILLPAVERLRPAIQTVADALGEMLDAAMMAVELLVEPLVFLGNIVAAVAQVFSGLTPLLKSWAVVAAGVQAVFVELFKALADSLGLGQFSEWVDQFKAAMRQLATAAIVAASQLARFLGFGDAFDKGIRNALTGANRKSAMGFGAAQDAKVGSDISGFGREVAALAALATTGGPGAKKDEEQQWRADTLKALDQGQKFLKEFEEKVVKAIEKAAIDIGQKITGQVYDKGKEAAKAVGTEVGLNALGPLGIGINLARRAMGSNSR
jgi:hypothetical protein